MPWKLLDLFFLVFHSAWIVFNLFGWIFPRTRRLNLFTLLLTGLSWTVLGIFYGFGYCPFTDWHWQVLAERGISTGHTSYVSYLLERLLGMALDDARADRLTLLFYLLSLACSVGVNFFMKKKKLAG